MSKCERKRVPVVKICAGDLRNKIDIQTRSLGGNSIGVVAPSETFTTLFSPWAAIETPNGKSRFLGVDINDQTTHIFIVRYDSTIVNIEVKNNFILFNSNRMKILRVKNMNEDNIFLAIECTERGDDGKAATEA